MLFVKFSIYYQLKNSVLNIHEKILFEFIGKSISIKKLPMDI